MFVISYIIYCIIYIHTKKDIPRETMPDIPRETMPDIPRETMLVIAHLKWGLYAAPLYLTSGGGGGAGGTTPAVTITNGASLRWGVGVNLGLGAEVWGVGTDGGD